MAVTLSFRVRVLLIVLLVALVPLGLVGLWLTRSAARTGESLMHERLTGALGATLDAVIGNWIRERSRLLSVAESPGIRDALRAAPEGPPPPELVDRFAGLGDIADAITVADSGGRAVWALRREAVSGAPAVRVERPAFGVHFDIWEGLVDRPVGRLTVRVRADALLPTGATPPQAAGTVIALFDAQTGMSLIPVSFDPLLLEAVRFQWGGETWVTERRSLAEPPVTVVVAAAVTPFTVPFEGAARQGTLLLLGVAMIGLVMAVLLTRRLTGSLEDLSEAAAAVSAGDLARRVEVGGADEVGRVARAFNTMTESLERTLAELASRESLAAVGQFAASLAHEIRNPLTAIRVDLQRVRAGLPGDSALLEPHERALNEIVRLDETVAKALRAARHGGVDRGTFDLRTPIRAASEAARPAFDERKAHLTLALPDEPLPVEGDAGALEQLFLNLVQNAAQALDTGGCARVEAWGEDGAFVVNVADNGAGVPAALLSRVFDPLFTTRPEGTGLGLTIARRIAEAHSGSIELASGAGEGTTARVRLSQA